MRAASFLKSPLPATVESAAMALRSTRTPEELVSVWWRDADAFEGAARERLQAIYNEQLRRMGALHG